MSSTIKTSRRWMYWIAATACLCATASWAQNYPVKPVRYVIPFPAGTGNDIVGRLLTDRLTRLCLAFGDRPLGPEVACPASKFFLSGLSPKGANL